MMFNFIKLYTLFNFYVLRYSFILSAARDFKQRIRKFSTFRNFYFFAFELLRALVPFRYLSSTSLRFRISAISVAFLNLARPGILA